MIVSGKTDNQELFMELKKSHNLKSRALKAALTIIPLILAIFACSLPLPSKIEIMGTPELSFNANKSLTEMFEDMLGVPESDAKMEILPCKNVEYQTYIIHVELYNDELDIDLDTPDELNGQSYTSSPDGKTIKMDNDVEILQDTIKSISFGGGLNTYFENFEYSEVSSTIFISGSDLINSLRLEIEGMPAPDGVDPDYHDGIYKVYPTNAPSGYEGWGGEYAGKTMPEGCKTFNISSYIMSGRNIDFNFKVFLKKGEEIERALLNIPITVEFIVWYPLVFTAIDDNAKIDFPDDFFGDGESDLFGRPDPKQDDKKSPIKFIQNLELAIKLNHNLFNGAKLNIKSKGVAISADEITDQSLSFNIDEENMKKINEPDNYPFNPKFSFNFKKDGRVIIPWELNAEEFSLKARLYHAVSFHGEDN